MFRKESVIGSIFLGFRKHLLPSKYLVPRRATRDQFQAEPRFGQSCRVDPPTLIGFVHRLWYIYSMIIHTRGGRAVVFQKAG